MEVIQSNDELQQVLAEAERPVVLLFSTEDCPYCRQLVQVAEWVEPDYGEQLDLYYVALDEDPAMAADYDIWGVPVMIKIVQGEVAARLDGYQPEAQVRKLMEA